MGCGMSFRIQCTYCGDELDIAYVQQFGSDVVLKVESCGCINKSTTDDCEFVEDCEHVSALQDKFKELSTKYRDLEEKSGKENKSLVTKV